MVQEFTRKTDGVTAVQAPDSPGAPANGGSISSSGSAFGNGASEGVLLYIANGDLIKETIEDFSAQVRTTLGAAKARLHQVIQKELTCAFEDALVMGNATISIQQIQAECEAVAEEINNKVGTSRTRLLELVLGQLRRACEDALAMPVADSPSV